LEEARLPGPFPDPSRTLPGPFLQVAVVDKIQKLPADTKHGHRLFDAVVITDCGEEAVEGADDEAARRAEAPPPPATAEAAEAAEAEAAPKAWFEVAAEAEAAEEAAAAARREARAVPAVDPDDHTVSAEVDD